MPVNSSISQAAQTESQQFVNVLQDLLSIIEEMSPHVPEGIYLEAMNKLGEFYKFKPGDRGMQVFRPLGSVDVGDSTSLHADQIMENLVQHHIARTRMRVQKKSGKRQMDVAAKLKSGSHVLCERCDSCVAKYGVKDHQMTAKCKRISRTKGLTHNIDILDTSQYEHSISIIDRALRKCPIKSTRNAWGYE